jgi:hypothetical protein
VLSLLVSDICNMISMIVSDTDTPMEQDDSNSTTR